MLDYNLGYLGITTKTVVKIDDILINDNNINIFKNTKLQIMHNTNWQNGITEYYKHDMLYT